jgi:hypothetical protein
MLSRKTFWHFILKKNLEATPSHLLSRNHPFDFFWWKSPCGWDFLGHSLLLSRAFFGWESLNGWDFLGHNLLLSQASFGGNPLIDGIF